MLAIEKQKMDEAGEKAIIKITNLRKKYGLVQAVDDVSFEIKKGEIFGLLGPNGAGKTTTIRSLTGIVRPDDGTITVREIDALRNPTRAKEIIGVIPEMTNCYLDMNVEANLKLTGELYLMSKREINQRMEELLKKFEIYDKKYSLFGKLSKGQKQRVLVVAALLPDPEILVLDEPSQGLDVISKRMILQILREEVTKKRKTVLLTTHDMAEANALCHRIAFIRKGKLIGIASPTEWKNRVREQHIVEVVFDKIIDAQTFSDVCQQLNINVKVTNIGDRIIVSCNDVDQVCRAAVSMVEKNKYGLQKILSLVTREPNLEEVFLEIINC
ncbi:MAG: ABC transporter ATP-binding protein [Candidatus Hermodarchaeota archaeon]